MVFFVAFAVIALGRPAFALDNGLARTPAVGWNAWNTFGCSVNENLIEQVADALVRSGMRDAGYRYLVLDDCWMGGRDKHGALLPNAARFPHGMKALGAYLHTRGLRFGIYESPNVVTCGVIYSGYPKTLGVGSLGHEDQDAQTFASWGVDYLKYDHCRGDDASFARMRDALKATGRPIVYSINPEIGIGQPRSELPTIANSARIGEDIAPDWDAVMHVLDEGVNLAIFAHPGFWNDFDMLEVGNGMSAVEDRAHFAMWAMMSSPLLAGNDVRTMSSTTKSILENREIIAINQDPLGEQALLADEPTPTTQIWVRRLASPGTYAIALLNRGPDAARIEVPWNWHVGFNGPASVRDLWDHKDLGTFRRGYATTVPAHGAAIIKVTTH